MTQQRYAARRYLMIASFFQSAHCVASLRKSLLRKPAPASMPSTAQAAVGALEARREVRAGRPDTAPRPCDQPAQDGRAACPACLCTGKKLQLNGGFARGASAAAPQPSPRAPACPTCSSRFVRAQDVAAGIGAAAVPASGCPRPSPRCRAPRRRAARRRPRRRRCRRLRCWGRRLGRPRLLSASCGRAAARARLARPLLRRARRR